METKKLCEYVTKETDSGLKHYISHLGLQTLIFSQELGNL